MSNKPHQQRGKSKSIQKKEDPPDRSLSTEDLKKIMESNPDAAQELFTELVSFSSYEWSNESLSGPLPPPKILREYKDLDPDLFDQIKDMAKREQSHRHKRELIEVSGVKRGQFSALTIVLVSLGLAGYLLSIDQTIGGIGSLIFGLGNLIAPFLYRRSKEN